MILTGRHVSPEEGLQLGFVNEVVPHEQLMDAAMNWANRSLPVHPYRFVPAKMWFIRVLDSASLQDAMEAKYESVQAMVSSSDFVEGPKAFAEKRPPNWQGK